MTCLASPPMYWVDFDFWIFSFESFISRSRLSTSILVTITLACTTDETNKKNALYLSVDGLSAKVLIGNT